MKRSHLSDGCQNHFARYLGRSCLLRERKIRVREGARYEMISDYARFGQNLA